MTLFLWSNAKLSEPVTQFCVPANNWVGFSAGSLLSGAHNQWFVLRLCSALSNLALCYETMTWFCQPLTKNGPMHRYSETTPERFNPRGRPIWSRRIKWHSGKATSVCSCSKINPCATLSLISTNNIGTRQRVGTTVLKASWDFRTSSSTTLQVATIVSSLPPLPIVARNKESNVCQI